MCCILVVVMCRGIEKRGEFGGVEGVDYFLFLMEFSKESCNSATSLVSISKRP